MSMLERLPTVSKTITVTGGNVITGDEANILAAIAAQSAPSVDDILSDPRTLTLGKFLGLK